MSKTVSIFILLLVAAGGLYYYFFMHSSFSYEAGPILSTANSSSFPTPYLTDFQGRALYSFDSDQSLKSNCTDSCLNAWPVYEYRNADPSQYSDALSTRVNLMKRPDGLIQYAYGEKPLYYYGGDKNPGDITGHGIGGKWRLVPISE